MLIDTGKAGYDSVREFEQRVAPALAGDPILGPRDLEPYPSTEPAVQWLSQLASGRVLEIGCGFGRMSIALPWMSSYLGIDPVAAKIRRARWDYQKDEPWVRFECVNPREWHLDLKFDSIITVTVLQHLTRPDTIKTLELAREHLAANGRILCYEGCLLPVTSGRCEQMYAGPLQAEHMIPKPLDEIAEAAGITWSGGGCRISFTPKA